MHYAQSGDRLCSPQRIEEISLTERGESGLMRPVARIAQSVEQGIENPRVLGSIPSPGTTNLKNPPKRRVFAFQGSRRFLVVLNPDATTQLFHPVLALPLSDFLPLRSRYHRLTGGKLAVLIICPPDVFHHHEALSDHCLVRPPLVKTDIHTILRQYSDFHGVYQKITG